MHKIGPSDFDPKMESGFLKTGNENHKDRKFGVSSMQLEIQFDSWIFGL